MSLFYNKLEKKAGVRRPLRPMTHVRGEFMLAEGRVRDLTMGLPPLNRGMVRHHPLMSGPMAPSETVGVCRESRRLTLDTTVEMCPLATSTYQC